MSANTVERCYLYRFFDAGDRLLYVGIARDLGQRFSAHLRRSSWWVEATRGMSDTYPSRTEAELAEAVAIRSERPIFNVSRPTQAKMYALSGAVSNGADVVGLVAEVERVRELCGAQMVRLVSMRGNLESARSAYRAMRAKWLQSETDGESWAQKYFEVMRPKPVPVAGAEVELGNWGDDL